MVDVRRVKLPGVGVLHTFVTDDGGKVGRHHPPLRPQRPHHLRRRRRRRRRHEGLAAPGRERGAHPRRAARRHPDHGVAGPGSTRSPDSRSTGSRSTTTDHIAGKPLGSMTARRWSPGLTVVAVVRNEHRQPGPARRLQRLPRRHPRRGRRPREGRQGRSVFYRTGEFKAKRRRPRERAARGLTCTLDLGEELLTLGVLFPHRVRDSAGLGKLDRPPADPHLHARSAPREPASPPLLPAQLRVGERRADRRSSASSSCCSTSGSSSIRTSSSATPEHAALGRHPHRAS